MDSIQLQKDFLYYETIEEIAQIPVVALRMDVLKMERIKSHKI